MKDIELPRKVLVGDNVIRKVRDVARDLRLNGTPITVCDPITREIAGNEIALKLGSRIIVASERASKSSDIEIRRILAQVRKNKTKYIVAVGGGTIIDLVKVAAYESGIQYMSVPTAASHDGIASPQASIKRGKPVSVKTRAPLAIIADTRIIRNAPARLNAAGCADAISNYTAVLDWKLARKEKGEYYGDYAAALSMMSARIVMENAGRIRGNISILVEALISSGVAIAIAGSSRPCSGSEHLFSHALDLICDKPALHGEQCGVGTIMMSYLHAPEKTDWLRVRKALEKAGAPVNTEQLRIPEGKIIKALTIAHKVRDRYTILRNGLTRKEAVGLAKATDVI